MTDPTRGMTQLQEALAVFCAWETRTPREAPEELLARHEPLRELLEPMLAEEEPESDETSDEIGRELGPYRLVRELGRGGMGVVYEATEPGLGRSVALKVLSAHLTLSPTAIARFQREANLAANLEHPGIVDVFGVGQTGGHHWFAMELLRGTALDVLLRGLGGATDGNTLRELAQRDGDSVSESGASEDRLVFSGKRTQVMARIGLQLAEALAFAHAHGVLHRDVKPANAILLPTGRVVLTDFGLARQGDAPGMTQTGLFAGTPNYASPEQSTGNWDDVGPPSDVFSLGATLYELLSGRRAFDGDDVLHQIRHDDPDDLVRICADVPADLAAIVHKALEKDPLRRYASAAEFAADLRAWLELRPVSARRATTMMRIGRWARREPFRAALVGLLAIAIPGFAGLGGYVWASSDLVSAGEAALAEQRLDASLNRAYGDLAATRLGPAMRAFERIAEEHDAHPEALAGQMLVLGQLQTGAPLSVWLEAHHDVVDGSIALRKLADTMTRGHDPQVQWVRSRDGWQTSDYAIAGYYCLERGRSSTEIEWIERAARLFQQAALADDRLHYHCAWARAAVEASDDDAAAAALEGLRRLFPDELPALIAIADIAREIDPELAKESVVRAEKLAPNDPDVAAHAASFAARAGDTEDAITRYERVLNEHPRHVPALVGRARLAQQAEDDARAVELLLRAAEGDAFDVQRWLDGRVPKQPNPSFSPYARQGHTDYIVDLALGLADAGRHDEARLVLTRSRGIDDRFRSTRVAVAKMLFQANRLDQAHAQIAPVVDEDTDDITAWIVAAQIATGRGEDEEALRCARRACQLDPAHAAARLALAVVYYNRQDFEACEATAIEAVRLAPISERASRLVRDLAVWKEDPAYLLREAERFAECLFRAGRPTQAAIALREYLVMPPEEVLPGAAEHKARIEASIARYEEATSR